MADWWEWLGRILLTLQVMAIVGGSVAMGLAFALAPSIVSNSSWHSQVVVPTEMSLDKPGVSDDQGDYQITFEPLA